MGSSSEKSRLSSDKSSLGSLSMVDDSDADKSYDVGQECKSLKRQHGSLSSSEEEALLAFTKDLNKRQRKREEDPKPGCSHWTHEPAQPTPALESPEVSSALVEVTSEDNAEDTAASAEDSTAASSDSEVEPESAQKITQKEIELLASATGGLEPEEFMRKGKLNPTKRREVQEAFAAYGRVPTLTEIKEHFKIEVDFHKEEIKKLEVQESELLRLAEEFWESVKTEHGDRLKALVGRHGPRARAAPRSRHQHPCPMAGCSGRSINIRRHISQCHRYLTADEQEKLIRKYKELQEHVKSMSTKKPSTKQPTGATVKRNPERECSLCDKKVKRLDIHVEKVHQLQRKSQDFIRVMRQSLVLPEEVEEIQEVKVTAGTMAITLNDGVKAFLLHFEDYLKKHCYLIDSSRRAHVRMVNDVLTHQINYEVLTTLNGPAICKLFDNMDRTEPPLGFLESKKNVLRANTIRKILEACQRAVDCLALSDLEIYQIDDQEKRSTTKHIQVMRVKLRKEETIEMGLARRQKERENVTLQVIGKIMTSAYVNNTLDVARRSLTDPASRPATMTDFTRLRDVLITTMMIKNLRRPMEFAEFALAEYLEMKERKDPKTGVVDHVVQIARHKTATKGPALIFMNQAERQTLDAYVIHYRPLVTTCTSPKCYVFPNRIQMTGTSCCSKLAFSNLSRLICKVARQAAAGSRVTSRILRRSQITPLWEKNQDPAWRQKVATQCCHSLETATRYYEYSDKIEPGKTVVSTLTALRAEAVATDTETAPAGDEEPQEQRPVPSVELANPSDKAGDEEPQERPVPSVELANPSDKAGDEEGRSRETDSFLVPDAPSKPQGKQPDVSEQGSVTVSSGSDFPDNISVISSLGTASTSSVLHIDKEDMAEETQLDTAKIFKDITRAMRACNRSRRPDSVMVLWGEVREYMVERDSRYALWSAEKLRNKHKYIKSAKASLKKMGPK